MATRRIQLLLLQVLSSVLALNWFWVSEAVPISVCSSDADCTGPNEFCDIRTDFTPPCVKGLCSCNPCFTRVGVQCVKNSYVRSLGDNCTKSGGEVITVANAECDENTVQCFDGFEENSRQCAIKAACQRNADCPDDMACGSDNKCRCKDINKILDPTGWTTCVRSDLGSFCQEDRHCDHTAESWPDGYNSGGAKCVAGKCGCDDGFQPVQTGVIDPSTNRLMNKTICIRKTAVAPGRKVSETCSLNPLTTAATALNVCGANTFCFQCPEDVTEYHVPASDGVCRQQVKILLRDSCPERSVVDKIVKSSAPSGNGGAKPAPAHGAKPAPAHGEKAAPAHGEKATAAPSGHDAPASNGHGAPAAAGSDHGAPASNDHGAPAAAGSDHGAPASNDHGATTKAAAGGHGEKSAAAGAHGAEDDTKEKKSGDSKATKPGGGAMSAHENCSVLILLSIIATAILPACNV